MHDTAIKLHRERTRYSKLSGMTYDSDYCNHLLEQIQQMALEIAADKQGEEIKTSLEVEDLDPSKRSWYYDGYGRQRKKDY